MPPAPCARPQVSPGRQQFPVLGGRRPAQHPRLPIGELPQLRDQIEPHDGPVAVDPVADRGEVPTAREPGEPARADSQHLGGRLGPGHRLDLSAQRVRRAGGRVAHPRQLRPREARGPAGRRRTGPHDPQLDGPGQLAPGQAQFSGGQRAADQRLHGAAGPYGRHLPLAHGHVLRRRGHHLRHHGPPPRAAITLCEDRNSVQQSPARPVDNSAPPGRSPGVQPAGLRPAGVQPAGLQPPVIRRSATPRCSPTRLTSSVISYAT